MSSSTTGEGALRTGAAAKTRPHGQPVVPGAPLRRVGLVGLGSHLPERVLDNAELERMVETSDEWIVQRTGIRERRLAAADEATSDLALPAARRALEQAGLAPEELDLILVATATPDTLFPSTAARVQHALGAYGAAGMDVSAACAGFLYALMTGHRLVASGGFRNALVIGAEKLSSIVDYEDRETCVLFGDGAGAAVLEAGDRGHELADHEVGLDGRGLDLIHLAAGGSRLPASHATVDAGQHYMKLRGREVFRFAVERMTELVELLAERNGLSVDELAWFVPHQANRRILDGVAKQLGMPRDRIAMNVDRTGNTSAASIPMALDELQREGKIREGDWVACAAFGSGLSWSASLLRW